MLCPTSLSTVEYHWRFLSLGTLTSLLELALVRRLAALHPDLSRSVHPTPQSRLSSHS